MKPKNPIFFISIFCIVSLFLFLLLFSVKQVKMPNLAFSLPFFPAKKVTTANASPSASEKSVVIAEDTLNNTLKGTSNDYVKDPLVKVAPDGITITGSAKKFLNLGLEMTGTPFVEREEIRFKVTSAKVGFLSPPKFLFAKISDLISAQLNNNVTQDLKITSVELSDKKIIIKGK